MVIGLPEQELPYRHKIPVYRLVAGYTVGRFPMGIEGDEYRFHWIKPKARAIFPLMDFHIPRRLKRYIRQNRFAAAWNTDFLTVIRNCGHRPGSWINRTIIDSYIELHRMGLAHSLQIYHSRQLIGGLYGVSLGGAFFGESMYSQKTMASQIALIHLMEQLYRAGFCLLDAQFITPHLQRFGAALISDAHFQLLLQKALSQDCRINSVPFESDSRSAVQSLQQMS